jgi:hypothetical protein
MKSHTFILPAPNGEGECSERSKDPERVAGRITRSRRCLRAREAGFALSRAATIAALRVARGITLDLNLKEAFQIGNALVELIADVDILSVTKQRAIRLGASGFASAFEFRFACGEAF